jgi:hypothetical protein
MPIAHCIVSPAALNSAAHGSDPAKIWAQLSDESAEELTVTLVKREQQYGKSYHVMAQLYLPSIWSIEKIQMLKLNLAEALSIHFSIPVSEVFVITRIVESEDVIENGEIANW